MLGANLTMVYALVTPRLLRAVRRQVGSRATPLVFTIVSLWSALEGSILFWGAILAVYVFAFARAHRNDPPTNPLLALGTMLAVGVFFAFLIAGPANPFGRVDPVPPGRPGPQPAAAEPRADGHPPADALPGLRGHDGALRHRGGGAAPRRAGRRVDGGAAPLDAHPLDLPLGRHRPRRRGGPTRCSAGAATGPGIRWRTPRSCPGSPRPRSSTRRWCRSAGTS